MADDFSPMAVALPERVRFLAHETATRYTEARIWTLINQVAASVMTDLTAAAENPITVRHRITFVEDVYEYVLPPYVSEVTRAGTFDATNRVWDNLLLPGSRWNPYGPNFEFVGQSLIRFHPRVVSAGATFDVEFIPTGELLPHAHTGHDFGQFNLDESTLVLNPAPTYGLFDRRYNAFVGAVLRVYAGPTGTRPFFPISEHLITAYDADTGKVTVTPPFPDWYGAGEYSYEVVPVFGKAFTDLVVLRSAVMVAKTEAPETARSLLDEYRAMRRGLQLRWSQMQSIEGRYFEHA